MEAGVSTEISSHVCISYTAKHIGVVYLDGWTQTKPASKHNVDITKLLVISNKHTVHTAALQVMMSQADHVATQTRTVTPCCR